MKSSRYLFSIIILLGLILCSCSDSTTVDESTFLIDDQERIIESDSIEFDEPSRIDPNLTVESDDTREASERTDVSTNTHENHNYDENCEECPPPRITDGIEIDGPGGMNPNWPTESDNPNQWPKNMGDLDTDDQDLEIEKN